MNETCPCINRNARPNNNQLVTYNLHERYLLRIQQYPVNNTYNTENKIFLIHSLLFFLVYVSMVARGDEILLYGPDLDLGSISHIPV